MICISIIADRGGFELKVQLAATLKIDRSKVVAFDAHKTELKFGKMNPTNKHSRTTSQCMHSIVDLEEHLYIMLEIYRDKET